MAISHACKEVIWLKGLFNGFGKVQDKVIIVCDSQSTINLTKTLAYHKGTKHSEVKYYFIRQVIDQDGVTLEKVHTQ